MVRAGPQAAFVLHQWAWSETSLVLDLFTREQGRVAVVAKGAKRPYSQLRSVLLPFQRIQVTLGRPRADDSGDVVTLRSAEFAGGATLLPPARLFAGFYLNELLMKLLARQDPHPGLFDAYADALAELAAGDPAGDEAVLRAFELWLLRETGVLPELDRVTTTQEPMHADGLYALRAEAGLVALATGEPGLAATDCLALQAALDDHDPPALRAACAAALPALRAQVRPLLHYHLGSPQLRTRQAMIEVRRLLDGHPENVPR
ncbi:DNA repair protein RecO [Ideonella sp. A 288]|uniref:DNA repair protein RecO n=1 Tax=Ideonella sp. A 288 TaxID=1962181 RepID=UPI000B4BF5D4|nr:DNA repair protein RecO [Ideonella sp. A 288]